MKRILVLFGLFVCIGTVNAQQTNFDTYTNQLFFNIFKPRPDTAIAEFLRRYTPSLYFKHQTGNTTGDALGKKDFSLEIHSFLFTHHPFFQASFTNGKIEFYCQRYPDPIGTKVYDVKLWFTFDTQQEADMAFSKLVETYIPISTKKKISSLSGYQQAEFSEESSQNLFSKIKFRYTSDNLDQHRYKILFETTNDL
ncbi:MAG: hypothetical protein KGO92_01645 [Bacteroidota bacterium]|nr:hypothetical protein [Bacteroidota bacterium]